MKYQASAPIGLGGLVYVMINPPIPVPFDTTDGTYTWSFSQARAQAPVTGSTDTAAIPGVVDRPAVVEVTAGL